MTSTVVRRWALPVSWVVIEGRAQRSEGSGSREEDEL